MPVGRPQEVSRSPQGVSGFCPGEDDVVETADWYLPVGKSLKYCRSRVVWWKVLSCREGKHEFNHACEYPACKSSAWPVRQKATWSPPEVVFSFLVPLASVLFLHLVAGQWLCWSLRKFIMGFSSNFTSGLCICGCSRVWLWKQLGCSWWGASGHTVAGVQTSWVSGLGRLAAPTVEDNIVNLRTFGVFSQFLWWHDWSSAAALLSAVDVCWQVSEWKPACLPNTGSLLWRCLLALSRGVVSH